MPDILKFFPYFSLSMPWYLWIEDIVLKQSGVDFKLFLAKMHLGMTIEISAGLNVHKRNAL